jgi:hypothetical protein
MISTAEYLLLFGTLLFYILDSTFLVFANDLVLVKRGSSWKYQRAMDLRIAGKQLFLPSPFAPTALLVRATWNVRDRGEPIEGRDSRVHYENAFSIPQRVVPVQACLLFVALPAALLLNAGAIPLLLLAVSIYSLSLVLAWWVHAFRAALELSGRQVFSICVDILACPPFALNVVRKVCLARQIRGDGLRNAREVLPVREFASLAEQVEMRLADRAVGDGSLANEPGSDIADRLRRVRS